VVLGRSGLAVTPRRCTARLLTSTPERQVVTTQGCGVDGEEARGEEQLRSGAHELGPGRAAAPRRRPKARPARRRTVATLVLGDGHAEPSKLADGTQAAPPQV
jgi:hypothetical protein